MPATPADLLVRAAARADVTRIIELAAQLGYPLSLRRTEATIETAPDRVILLATTAGEVVGWIAVALDRSLLGEGDAWIEGLVVDEAHRNRGIGVALVRAAHRWARERECTRVRVRSNIVRDGAHRFYEREGYRRFKTQHNFEFRL